MAVPALLIFLLLSLRTYDAATLRSDCDELAQAFDELWETIPATQPPGLSLYYIDQAGAERSFHDLTGSESRTIATSEGRHEIACLLADVQSLSDLAELLPRSTERDYRQVKQWLFEDGGLAAVDDLGQAAGLMKYFLRISGFPNFPLDLYDSDMALYFLNRTFSHEKGLLLIAPRLGNPDEYLPRIASALMSDTAEEFRQQGNLPRGMYGEIILVSNYVNVYTDMVQRLVKVIRIAEKMGLFNLQ